MYPTPIPYPPFLRHNLTALERGTKFLRCLARIGCSSEVFRAHHTALLMGTLKPPPVRASCQDGFRFADPPSFACRDSQMPRLRRLWVTCHQAAMVVAGNKIEGEQPCLTPNQAKAPRNPQPTLRTRYVTARDIKASGHASDRHGHTPMGRDSTSNSIVCRSTDASASVSPPKRKTNATGRAPRARPLP